MAGRPAKNKVANLRILIVGGYGFFGTKLCDRIKGLPGLSVTIAGRDLGKAQSACAVLNGDGAAFTPLCFDRSKDAASQIGDRAFDLIIDVSGPFQSYGETPYRLVDYAISRNTHYMDIADGADFVSGILDFDQAAKHAGCVVLSGVSTYPALTHSVISELAKEMDSVETVRAGISPSPHTEMGRSVVDAIASYAGRPFPVLKDAQVDVSYGLTETIRRRIAAPGKDPLDRLVFTNVDVPDGQLFFGHPKNIKTVWNGAGPKPAMLLQCLVGLSRLVRRRLFPGLGFLAPFFHWVMRHVAHGPYRGGMFVEIAGLKNGQTVRRDWHLVAEGDDGPNIPILPLVALIKKALAGQWPEPGARAPLGDVTLADYEAEFAGLAIHAGVFETQGARSSALSLYEKALGSAYSDLAQPLQDLHRIGRRREFHGRCKVTRGRNPLSQLIAFIFGLPQAANDIPVRVVLSERDGIETWERFFDGRRMISTQEYGKGRAEKLITERFGPVAIYIAVLVEDGKMVLKTKGWSVFGITLPRFLVPGGEVYEHDADGRFNFHVDLVAPLIGRMVKYEGWLE